MSFSTAVSGRHNRLALVLAPHAGREVTNAQVKAMFAEHYGQAEANWIIAADHCDNHGNDGSCVCSHSPAAVLHKIGPNRYRVVP